MEYTEFFDKWYEELVGFAAFMFRKWTPNSGPQSYYTEEARDYVHAAYTNVTQLGTSGESPYDRFTGTEKQRVNYVKTCIVNLMKDKFRSHDNRFTVGSNAIEQYSDLRYEDQAIASYDARQVLKALEKHLTDKQVKVLILKAVGMSAKTIGTVLDISPDTVRDRAYVGRKNVEIYKNQRN